MFLHLVIWPLAIATAASGGAFNPETHILGGDDVAEGGRPYQVSLDYKGDTYEHFCGGAILNEKWVITAAHCLKDLEAEDISILSGTDSLSKGGKRHDVKEAVVHEKFEQDTPFDYDISLLKITDTFSFDGKTAAISVATKNTGGGVTCVVSGWGYVDNRETDTDKMKILTVNSLSNKECREGKLKQFQHETPLTANQICTYREKGKGICQGDSGGPLTCNGELVGLTSYNVPCARGYPDVFTRVFKFKDWIVEHMK